MNIRLNFVLFLTVLFGAALVQAKSTVHEFKKSGESNAFQKVRIIAV